MKTIFAILFFILIVILSLFFAGVLPPKNKIPPGAQNEDSTKIEGVAIKATREEIPITYNTVGTIQSREDIKISSRLVAKIIEILVREGDKIEKDQLLARLDDSDLKANSARAIEKLKEAEAALILAQKELERSKTLFEKNAIPKKSLEQAESAFQAASANFAAAKEAVNEAEAMLSYAYIKSPISGIVAKRFLEPGDLASPSISILQIFDDSRLMLHVPINESLISKIKIGDKLIFSVDALGKDYEGELKEISNQIDPQTRSFMAKICLGKAPGLLPGMFGRLKIKIESEKAILIPNEAIIRIGQLEYVIKTDGKDSYVRTLIRTVESPYRDKRKIVSGLNEGDIIILNKPSLNSSEKS